MPLIKPIHTSLSPNTRSDDALLALRLIFTPRIRKTPELEEEFKNYLGAKYAFSLNSGRSALFVILKAIGIKEGDEVLTQAFTCNAVANPIFWAGGRPVYADVDDSLNIDPLDIEKKITEKTKAILVQHTLGIPAKMDTIKEIAKTRNLILIEDCAHALGATYIGKKLGTFGDISFFSFGRDKVISSVWGGIITTNNDEVGGRIGDIYAGISTPHRLWTAKQLLHPLLFSVIVPTYYIFGKYLLAALRRGGGITLAVSREERIGKNPGMFPKRMSEGLAALALHQFKKLEKYNTHRKKIAAIYKKELSRVEGIIMPPDMGGAIYLRFNILNKRANEILKNAKNKHILLGDWYKNIIDPRGTDLEDMGYKRGTCPNAEFAAKHSINLPTHINISENDARQVIQHIRNSR